MAAHYWFFSDDSSFFLPFSNVRCENEGEGCSSVFLKLQWNKKITWNINSLFTVSSIIIIIIIIDELMFFPPHFLLFSLIILQICMCFEFFPSYLKKKKRKWKGFITRPLSHTAVTWKLSADAAASSVSLNIYITTTQLHRVFLLSTRWRSTMRPTRVSYIFTSNSERTSQHLCKCVRITSKHQLIIFLSKNSCKDNNEAHLSWASELNSFSCAYWTAEREITQSDLSSSPIRCQETF